MNLVSRTSRTLLLIILFAGCLLAVGALVNGTFGTGDLTGWSVAGTASVVGTQGPVVPPTGSFQALIASGDAYTDVAVGTLETDLNLPSGAIHTALPNNGTPMYGSAIWQTFTATAGNAVTFQWNFATSEAVPSYYDAALYTFQSGSNPAQVFELADTSQTAALATSSSGSPFSNKMTGYHTVTIPITTTGTYTIGFISMQTGDNEVVSGTYINNVAAGPGAPGVPTMSATGLSILGVLLAAMSVLLLSRSSRRRTT